MKYYRIEFTFDNYYIVQRRKWGIWRNVREYQERSDAFMHLDSLNRGELIRRERFWQKSLYRTNYIRRIRWSYVVRQFLNKWRS